MKAFPTHGDDQLKDDPRNRILSGGMDLRDYFAAKALQGLWASHGNPSASSPIHYNDEMIRRMAKACYRMADEMMIHHKE